MTTNEPAADPAIENLVLGIVQAAGSRGASASQITIRVREVRQVHPTTVYAAIARLRNDGQISQPSGRRGMYYPKETHPGTPTATLLPRTPNGHERKPDMDQLSPGYVAKVDQLVAGTKQVVDRELRIARNQLVELGKDIGLAPYATVLMKTRPAEDIALIAVEAMFRLVELDQTLRALCQTDDHEGGAAAHTRLDSDEPINEIGEFECSPMLAVAAVDVLRVLDEKGGAAT